MYTKFTETTDGGYQLKKQGVVSSAIIIVFLVAFCTLLFKIYFDDTHKREFLYYGLFMLALLFFPLNRLGCKLIIYPHERLFKYEVGFIGKRTQFAFSDFDGVTVFRRSSNGIGTGNTFAVNYFQNDKQKTAKIGVNVSAKSQRIILEEIKQIMNGK